MSRPSDPPSRGASRRALGDYGERLAESFLVERGYGMIARNVHTRVGEIDRIALCGETLCFVEVRLRRSRRYGSSADSVDPRKQMRLVRAARAWLARRVAPPHVALRFDVVAIDASSEPPRIELYQDAFRCDA